MTRLSEAEEFRSEARSIESTGLNTDGKAIAHAFFKTHAAMLDVIDQLNEAIGKLSAAIEKLKEQIDAGKDHP